MLIKPLQRRNRLSCVPKFPVIIILSDKGLMFGRPFEQLNSSVYCHYGSQRKLMGRCDIYKVWLLFFDLLYTDSFIIDWYRNNIHAIGFKNFACSWITRILIPYRNIRLKNLTQDLQQNRVPAPIITCSGPQ